MEKKEEGGEIMTMEARNRERVHYRPTRMVAGDALPEEQRYVTAYVNMIPYAIRLDEGVGEGAQVPRFLKKALDSAGRAAASARALARKSRVL
jgi:hypothetical protein